MPLKSLFLSKKVISKKRKQREPFSTVCCSYLNPGLSLVQKRYFHLFQASRLPMLIGILVCFQSFCPNRAQGQTASLTGSATICAGGSADLSIELTGNQPWSITYNDGTNDFTVSGITATPHIISVSPATTTTYTLTGGTDGDSNALSMSGTAVITVNPLPAGDISGDTSICAGSLATLTVTLTGTQPWEITYSDGTTPVTVSGITTSPFTVDVSPSTTSTYTLTAVKDANCDGTSMTGSATVTVKPVPVVTVSPPTETFCSGGSTAITLSSLTPGATFTWTAALTSGTATGFADGTGTSIAQTLTNATADPATVTYTITPAADGCTGLPVNVVVTVNPIPDSHGYATVTILLLGRFNRHYPIEFNPGNYFYLDGGADLRNRNRIFGRNGQQHCPDTDQCNCRSGNSDLYHHPVSQRMHRIACKCGCYRESSP
jgi:hypothetical protein